MSIELKPTNRGFIRGDFKDRYGAECSIQESSLAEEYCLWLGCNHETVHDKTGQPCGSRMHLTQQMAAGLIPLLSKFVETGRLS